MSKALICMDKSKAFRVYLTNTTDLVQEAKDIHKTTPLATAGLGRVLTGCGIMSILLKNPTDKLTIMFKGEGPAKQIIAVGNGQGHVKGYIANPNVDLPLTKEGKLDVGGSLGVGDLTVIKDIGLKEPYSGKIDLVSGEIAEDLTAYYYISEQQNTSMALGVKIDRDLSVLAAGGMFIQMLPGAEEQAIEVLEDLTSNMLPITSYVEKINNVIKEEGLSEEKALEKMLDEIFMNVGEDYKPEILEARDIDWRCDCSKDVMARALLTLGTKELTQILEEDHGAQLSCHFCGSKYEFSQDEIEVLIQQSKNK